MSITEILDELPKLKAQERHMLFERLEQLEGDELEETPEMLAAIDEGIRSAETEPGHSIEKVRAEIPSWLTKLS